MSSTDSERKGMVERGRDTDDRRAYSLQATRAGRRVLDRGEEAAQRAEDDFLAGLAGAEREQLESVLRGLIAPR